ncbi:MAG: glycosyltransferase family 2 protein [Bacteroidota bacterium]
MPALSVIIPTYNEAAHIEAALQSVAWADELIVVDSFSTDDTLAIARRFPVRILERAYKSPADQKNWAIPQARHEWVLLLDADERITPQLAKEIQQLLQQPPPQDAYWIRRSSFFLGKRIRYSGWQGDKVIRLIRRDRCRYREVQVHEEIATEGIQVGQLKAAMDHYTCEELTPFLEKMRRYGQWSALDHRSRTPRVGYFHLLVKPLWRFVNHYLLRLGFLDGWRGLLISAIMAWGVFLRYAYLWEWQWKERKGGESHKE